MELLGEVVGPMNAPETLSPPTLVSTNPIPMSRVPAAVSIGTVTLAADFCLLKAVIFLPTPAHRHQVMPAGRFLTERANTPSRQAGATQMAGLGGILLTEIADLNRH